MSPRTTGIVVLVGVVGWVGLIWLGVRLSTTEPPTAAFDLELLLRAGRDVAAGRSPYDPAMLAGTAPVAERLFYSYPPVVAQALALVAWLPSPVLFAAWTAAAVAGLGWIARSLAVRFTPAGISPERAALTAIALAPLVSPFAIGLLFGNLDVFFPLLFGLVLLGALPGAAAADLTVAGVAASVAGVAKLHPLSVGLWLLVRASTSPRLRRAVGVAVVVALAILGISVAVGGVGPWLDYATVVRAGSGADLVDPRNAGPAAQIALLLRGTGADADALARTLQIPVTLAALGVTVAAAVRVADPVESLAWAVAASLVILPVTWFHYPAALIPFAIAALLRAPRDAKVRATVAAAAVVAAIGIAALPLIYVAIGLVIAAARMSRPVRAPAPG